jgi:hypothetical protein
MTMFKRTGSHLRRNVVAYGALLLAAGSSAAVAGGAIPNPDGTISSCVAKSGGLVPLHEKGTVRIVDESGSCRDYEQPLSWNQRGPKGDPGPQGDVGPKGDPGDPGHVEVVVRKGESGVAMCEEGEQALSGGWEISTTTMVAISRPIQAEEGAPPTGWEVTTGDGNTSGINTYVVCTS